MASNQRGLECCKVFIILVLTMLFFTTEKCAFASVTRLDESTEVQWVMGDLSALKTAIQMYYNEHDGNTLPPLSGVLDYFEPGSVPQNAPILYSLKSNAQGWYVGYSVANLQPDTYRLLEENAQSLGLLCDDLRTPWRYGSHYFWSEALALGSSPGNSPTVIRQKDASLDAARLIFATAALINVIADYRHNRYYYYVPGYDWYWHSALAYRPIYYDRFFYWYYRPFSSRPSYFAPRYRYRVPRAGWLGSSWRNSIRETRRRDEHRFSDRGPGGRPWDRQDHNRRSHLSLASPNNRGPRNPNVSPHSSLQTRSERKPPHLQQPPRRNENRQPPRLQQSPRRNENRQSPKLQEPQRRSENQQSPKRQESPRRSENQQSPKLQEPPRRSENRESPKLQQSPRRSENRQQPRQQQSRQQQQGPQRTKERLPSNSKQSSRQPEFRSR